MVKVVALAVPGSISKGHSINSRTVLLRKHRWKPKLL